MPILAVLDEGAHGALDDSLKTLYVQNTEDKKFYLDIAPDEAEKVAFNLKTKFESKKADLSRVHGEKTATETKLKAYEALGKTADELKAALESNRPEEVTKLVEKYEAEKRALQTSFDEAIGTEKTARESAKRQLEKTLTEATIARIRNEYDLNETADYVLRDYIKVVPVEGSDEYAVKVFENGQPALVAGQEMKPDQLISSWKEQKKFPAMFNAGTGGGSNQNPRQYAGGAGGKVFTVSREASKTNPAMYQQAKEEAAKVGGTVTFTD